MKYILIDIGRKKFNGIIEAKNDDQLLREIEKHLMSSDVSCVPDKTGWTVLAGFRPVGRVERALKIVEEKP